jgi:hypothetical protein
MAMAATFNATLASDLDKVRQRLGDTDTNDAQFEDETIMAMLDEPGMNYLTVAAQLARDLSARYARKVDTDVDGQGFKWSNLSKQFLNLAADLTSQARRLAVMDATGEATGALGGGILVSGATAQDVYDSWNDHSRARNVRRP